MYTKLVCAATAGLLMAGCASLPKVRFTGRGGASSAPTAPIAKTSTPIAPQPAAAAESRPTGVPIANELVTTPGVRKAYYVGQIIDPAHPELMYRPGVVIREEVPERWNRNPAARQGFVSGIIAALPDSAILPPRSPEMEQMIAQQRRAMQLLADSNEKLSRRLEELNGDGSPGPAGTTPAAANTSEASLPGSDSTAAGPPHTHVSAPTAGNPPPSVTAYDAVDLSRAIVPNADGAIELSPEIFADTDPTEPNPFLKRFQAKPTLRELVVTVSGTSLGPRPTANVNGRLVNVGDRWEGFTVAAITRDAVYLQKENFLLQIPLTRATGVTVRIPL